MYRDAPNTSELLDELLPDDRVIADVRADLAGGGLRDEEPAEMPPADVAMSVMSKSMVRTYYAPVDGRFETYFHCQVSVGAMLSNSSRQQVPEFSYASLRYGEDLQLLGVDYGAVLF